MEHAVHLPTGDVNRVARISRRIHRFVAASLHIASQDSLTAPFHMASVAFTAPTPGHAVLHD